MQIGNIKEAPGGWLGAIVKGFGAWRSRAERASAMRQMQIVEALTLGPKKQLVLVRCCGRHFLVGSGAEGIQSIVAVAEDRSPCER